MAKSRDTSSPSASPAPPVASETWAEAPFSAGRRWLLLACVFALAWLPFLPALHQGWVDWDDNQTFNTPATLANGTSVPNPFWRGLSAENVRWIFSDDSMFLGHYQPLSWLSYAAEYELWGENPARMHLVNLLLHALNAVLFARLAARLIAWARAGPAVAEPAAAWIGGAAAALFFALHPLRVESVAWATERRDVLSTFFLLATTLCWLHTKDRSPGKALWWIATLACYALSLLSKAWGMTFPALLVLLELYPLATAARTRKGVALALLRTWPFVPLALWCAFKATQAQGRVMAAVSWSEHPLINRIMQSAWGAAFYLWKTLWPTHLSPLYELEEKFDPWQAGYVTALSVCIALTLALFFARKRFPAGIAAWIAFLILVSPVLGLSQSGAQKAADRYTYLACLPFALLAGAGLALLVERRAALAKVDGVLATAGGLAAGALVSLGVVAHAQTKIWASDEALWTRVIEVEPKSYIAHHNLAAALGKQNRVAEAIVLEQRCVELSPGKGNLAARDYLASLLEQSGKPEEALAALIDAFHVDPEDRATLAQLDSALARHAQRARMFTLIEEELAKNPKLVELRCQYAERLLGLGRASDAEAQYRAALAVDPGHAPSLIGLARLLIGTGRPNDAEPLLTTAIRGGQYNADALAELGAVRGAQGRVGEAMLLFDQALVYAPNHARALALKRQYSGGR